MFKFKADNKNVNFVTQFCLESIFNGFGASESRQVFLNGNVHDFLVGYNLLMNLTYLMTKNTIN